MMNSNNLLISHNLHKQYSYKGFVIHVYREQYTEWWFYQFYYLKFSLPQNLEWSQPLDYEQEAIDAAKFCIDEILRAYKLPSDKT
jgi:hypothetical protein